MGELSSKNFDVDPNPLEVQGGKVAATIYGKFPAKYMKKNAVVEVIPVLRYGQGKSCRSEGSSFQGESVVGNHQRIKYKTGGVYTMKASFDYDPEMLRSEMFMTFDARTGNRSVKIPEVKVARGVRATSELYRQMVFSGGACVAPDSFKRVTTKKQEAQVKYLINQAELRKSELRNNSVQEFAALLKRINRDKELQIRDIEVQGYASPEGGLLINDDLANRRQDTAEDYVNGQLRSHGMQADVIAHYTAEDWDGLEQLVKASNIQDKDVILRVLSMYDDPYEREQQIRNMSEGFRELADGILPELRRSRMIINYEVVGRSDQQIKDQYRSDASKLSVDELLYAASLEDDDATREKILRKAAELYPDDHRAHNNLGAIEAARGHYDAAETYFNEAAKGGQVPEAYVNLGMLALRDGRTADAEQLIARGIGAKDAGVALGHLNIAKGNYAEAVKNLEGSRSNSLALAQLLDKNYIEAERVLHNVEHKDGMTDYLQAVANARQGNPDIAESFLRAAFAKDPSLRDYAMKDIELANVKK